MTRANYGGLDVTIRGQGNGPLVVLLHGFGAPGTDLVPLAEYINAPPGTRFVFPEAPHKLPPMFGDGRAWWMIDIESRLMARAQGRTMELTREVPEGLAAVNGSINSVIDDAQADLSVGPEQTYLGGFSQGAMLSLDVALRSDRTLAGLLLMSGTLICADEWKPLMSKRKNLRCVLSHGRQDPMLPFEVSELLRDGLTDAGVAVDWVEFQGGHEIPPPVLAKAGELFSASA